MLREVLLASFRAYNEAIWPLQIVLVLLALALLLVGLRGGRERGRIVYGGVAVLWAWCGAVFFIAFYGRTAPAPVLQYVFGAAFLLQAALFARAAVVERECTLSLRADARALLGATMIVYALLVYPLLASALGQHYPAQPTFGAPCPLTIFTFGMLLLVTGRVPGHLLAIPFLWALAGFFPVLRAGVLEDTGLIVAGFLTVPLIRAHNRGLRATPHGSAIPGVGETPAPMEGTGRLR